MAAADTMADVLAYLRRHHDDCPQTPAEIAAALRVRVSAVRAALARLARDGQVRRLGVSTSGGRCWAATVVEG